MWTLDPRVLVCGLALGQLVLSLAVVHLAWRVSRLYMTPNTQRVTHPRK